MTISKTLSTLSLAGALIAAAVALSPSEASAAGKKNQRGHISKKTNSAGHSGFGTGKGGGSSNGNGGAGQSGFGGGNGGGNIARPCPACNTQG
jgi:hypothetical protein